jgi:anti-sigma regulatory factor (Ser/Thr protein kinase)
MSTADSGSNGGAHPRGPERSRHARSEPMSFEPAHSERRQLAMIEGLTVAVGRLRRGATALKAENRQLRAELAERRPVASSRRSGDAPVRELGELAEVELPAGSGAPGAARLVTAHCLTRLVVPRVLHDAELLVSELVTNSLDHGQLGEHATVLFRIYLTARRLRVEIENAGTAGAVVADHSDHTTGRGGFGLELVDLLATRWGVKRSHGTIVWFEMARS